LNYVHSKTDVRLAGRRAGAFVFDECEKIAKSSVGGYVEVGYGKFADASDWYFGINAVADIDKKGKKDCEIAELNCRVEQSGIIPSVSFRLGRYFDAIDALVFAEFGGCKNYCKVNVVDDLVDSCKCIHTNKSISPVVGIGVEKMFDDRVSIHMSLSYRVPSAKCSVVGGSQGGNYSVTSDTKTKGYVVREGCVYHF
jgi:hypothetical protein